MSKYLEVAFGKAATIVSPSQLAINVGEDAGVRIGDRVVVRRTVNVSDPDTKNVLGKVHLVRLRLKVTLVNKSFAVCEVDEVVPSSSTLGGLFDVTRVTQYKTIVPNASGANASTVYVEPGEPVVVSRTVETPAENE